MLRDGDALPVLGILVILVIANCNELPKSELTIHQLSQKATISELF